MTADLAAFVILAEMRTGSNHLQDSLNALSDVCVHGEIFNPAFIGQHNRDALFGIDMEARQSDPHVLLDRMIAQTEGIPGFRYFGDHDPRMRDRILTDPRIAKVVLTRDPLASYISWKIARATDQWRLTNPKMAKSAKVTFDGEEFDAMRDRQAQTRRDVRGILQRTGQTAFEIDYAEITDLDILNGLAAFLGSGDRLTRVPDRLKRQNPGDIRDKVTNPDEMIAHAGDVLPGVDLGPLPGPAVPTMMAAAQSPLLLMPLPGGPRSVLRDWLTALDGAAPTEGMRQNALRDWLKKTNHPETVAILRHPLHRAHDLFWRDVLRPRGADARDLRRILTNQHGIPMPRAGAHDESYDLPSHRAAFRAFLGALPALLGGQSSFSVPPGWASQSVLLAGMAQAILPQRIVSEEEAPTVLNEIAAALGRPAVPLAAGDKPPFAMDDILTDDMAGAARRAYGRDYLQFGFASVPAI